MLFHLLVPFADQVGPFNLFRYITFRSGGALVTALFISFFFGPRIIAWLKSKQAEGQPIRLDGPEGHLLRKKGTPTMGGFLILLALIVSTLLWADLANGYVWVTLLVTAGFGTVGFFDDYKKLTKRSSSGLSSRGKLVAQVAISAVATIVIVGSLAGSGTILWQHHTAAVRRQQAEQFIDAAKQGVVAVTSIDFNAVRDQVQHIIDNSTGAFREDFIARSSQFIQVAEASKAVAKGAVTAAAVESMKTDEAVVLLVGSEQISNAAGNQQPRSFRFRVTVTRDADQLKVSKLELVL